MKTNRSIRFDEKDLIKAEHLEIDINRICRDSLKEEIQHKEEMINFIGKKCPNCGKMLGPNDVTRLVNKNTDKFGIHNIGKNRKGICFNHIECQTTLYKIIKE